MTGPLLLAAVLSAGAAPRVQPAPAKPFFAKPPAGIEQSALLKTLRRSVELGTAGPLPLAARKAQYVLVPGIQWDQVPGYMETNKARLENPLGLRVKFLETDPMGTPEDGAEMLADYAKSVDGELVPIGHSLGALSAVAAARRSPNIKRVIAIQAPFQGSALADWFDGRPIFRAAITGATRLLRPSRLLASSPLDRARTVRALTSEARRGLSEPPPGVKVYSVVTRVGPETSVRWMFWLSSGLTRRLTGKDGDGIVAPDEGIIPGQPFAAIDHVGHADPVLAPERWTLSFMGARGHEPAFAATLTEAAVRWAFAEEPR